MSGLTGHLATVLRKLGQANPGKHIKSRLFPAPYLYAAKVQQLTAEFWAGLGLQ